MTITRALAEIKSLDARINNATSQLEFIKVRKQSQQLVNGVQIKDLEELFKSNFQSATDLIKRRHLIKSAVVKSNADTVVEIGEVKMTVAEAIDLKNTIGLESQLLSQLKSQYAKALQSIEVTNRAVDQQAEQEANNNFGSKQKSDPTEYQKFVQDYKDRNTVVLVDSIDIKSQIEKLQNYIETFETEVDFTLSESNALTKIEIA